MARRDAWSGGALALLAIFTLIESLRLDIGAITQPGPGFFPLVLSSVLALVAAGLLVNAWRARAVTRAAVASPDETGTDGYRTDPWKLVATAGALAVYIAVFERLGFLLATGGFLAFLFGALARYRWPIALLAAIALTLAAYVVFNTWLSVRLPRGLLGRW